MSAPYKRYISSAVCEGISKMDGLLLVFCFFNTSPIYLFFLPNMVGIMGLMIINLKISFLCLVKPLNTGFTGIGPSASHGP
jgi:hypothetical protein